MPQGSTQRRHVNAWLFATLRFGSQWSIQSSRGWQDADIERNLSQESLCHAKPNGKPKALIRPSLRHAEPDDPPLRRSNASVEASCRQNQPVSRQMKRSRVQLTLGLILATENTTCCCVISRSPEKTETAQFFATFSGLSTLTGSRWMCCCCHFSNTQTQT